MKNALAVYTSRSSLNGRKLADIAWEHGITLRFLAMGGYLPGNPDENQKKPLASVNGGALLLVGAIESDATSLAQLDEWIAQGDRAAIATLLKDGSLPWCELYTGRFNYQKATTNKPADKTKIDGSVAETELAAVESAKTRYIIFNQSRKKNGEQLMIRLAECLAHATDGVVANYQKPS